MTLRAGETARASAAGRWRQWSSRTHSTSRDRAPGIPGRLHRGQDDRRAKRHRWRGRRRSSTASEGAAANACWSGRAQLDGCPRGDNLTSRNGEKLPGRRGTIIFTSAAPGGATASNQLNSSLNANHGCQLAFNSPAVDDRADDAEPHTRDHAPAGAPPQPPCLAITMLVEQAAEAQRPRSPSRTASTLSVASSSSPNPLSPSRSGQLVFKLRWRCKVGRANGRKPREARALPSAIRRSVWADNGRCCVGG